MKIICTLLAMAFFWGPEVGVKTAFAAEVNGIWTKTTNPDPNNVAIFYNEKSVIKAMGYSEIQGVRNVWYAEGEINGKRLECVYHYGKLTAALGWELDGTMELTLSDDGNRISGTAKSASGNWSDYIEFKRIQLVPFLQAEIDSRK